MKFVASAVQKGRAQRSSDGGNPPSASLEDKSKNVLLTILLDDAETQSPILST